MKRFHSKQVKCVYQSNVTDVPSPTSTPMAGLLSGYKANEMNSLPHALKLWGQPFKGILVSWAVVQSTYVICLSRTSKFIFGDCPWMTG